MNRSVATHMKSYRDLEIWERGMRIAELAYRLTRDFPKAETFGLTSQIRRAAASIPANIAEGWGRQGDKEFSHFLRIANGSLRELETHLVLSQRVGLVEASMIEPLLQELTVLSKQFVALQRRLAR
jgi:four helix bundle protein